MGADSCAVTIDRALIHFVPRVKIVARLQDYRLLLRGRCLYCHRNRRWRQKDKVPLAIRVYGSLQIKLRAIDCEEEPIIGGRVVEPGRRHDVAADIDRLRGKELLVRFKVFKERAEPIT